jgi:hypothetical protein
VAKSFVTAGPHKVIELRGCTSALHMIDREDKYKINSRAPGLWPVLGSWVAPAARDNVFLLLAFYLLVLVNFAPMSEERQSARHPWPT